MEWSAKGGNIKMEKQSNQWNGQQRGAILKWKSGLINGMVSKGGQN